MIIKVLGSGCSKCKKLEENVHKALAEKGIKVLNVEQHSDAAENITRDFAGSESCATVIKVSDLKDIMGYGVMMTPALVIDEKVVSSGKLLSPAEIIKLIN